MVYEILDSIYQDSPVIHHKPDRLSQFLSKFLQEPSIKITASDKNLGITIWNTIDYYQQCSKHLDNPSIYQQQVMSSSDILVTINLTVTNFLEYLKQHEHINYDEYQFLYPANCTLANFHALPKLHKNIPLPDLPIRPIVASLNTPTTKLSIWLSHQLESFNYSSVLKNSRQLIEVLQKPTFPLLDSNSYILFTIDYSSLYTNIDIEELSQILNEINPLYASVFDTISTNNYFTFGNQSYKQLNGIAMGTNAAVHLANIYLHYKVDLPVLKRFKPNQLVYKRYIDDIFGMFKGSIQDFKESFLPFFTALTPNLKSTHVMNNSYVDFLDLTIYKSYNSVNWKIFQKSLNNYQYLVPSSLHPKHTLSGYIIGELIRYQLLHSSKIEEIKLRKKFFQRLINRGFTSNFLNPIFINHPKDNNKHILEDTPKKIVPLKIPLSRRNLDDILTSWLKSYKKVIPTAIHPVLVYQTPPNLAQLTIRNRLTPQQIQFLNLTS